MKHRIGLFDERGKWIRDLTEPIEADTAEEAPHPARQTPNWADKIRGLPRDWSVQAWPPNVLGALAGRIKRKLKRGRGVLPPNPKPKTTRGSPRRRTQGPPSSQSHRPPSSRHQARNRRTNRRIRPDHVHDVGTDGRGPPRAARLAHVHPPPLRRLAREGHRDAGGALRDPVAYEIDRARMGDSALYEKYVRLTVDPITAIIKQQLDEQLPK